jgi:2,3-bisphosphoglycerate-independent phosphoglycerate mutase
MHVLLIFLDGIGLGDDDPAINPFAAADLPTLHDLSNGHRWLRGIGRQFNQRATFLPLDTGLGVEGRPQSGTNQAVIVTGRNVPALIGRHFGPKPTAAVRAILDEDNIFKRLVDRGKSAAILEAYPPPWHEGIASGKHLPASYQYAAMSAGLRLLETADFVEGRALSGDWTGEGWRTQMQFTDTPLYTPYEAGRKLVELSRQYDFVYFPHWLTDIVGHRGPMTRAVELLQTFDGVMRGVLETWQDDEGLIIITSDHGNLEDLSHGRHTQNDVPGVIIGAGKNQFVNGLTDLTGLTPRIAKLLL